MCSLARLVLANFLQTGLDFLMLCRNTQKQNWLLDFKGWLVAVMLLFAEKARQTVVSVNEGASHVRTVG